MSNNFRCLVVSRNKAVVGYELRIKIKQSVKQTLINTEYTD